MPNENDNNENILEKSKLQRKKTDTIYFVIIFIVVAVISNSIAYEQGKSNYSKLDHSQETIYFLKSALGRYIGLYIQKTRECDILKEKFANQNILNSKLKKDNTEYIRNIINDRIVTYHK